MTINNEILEFEWDEENENWLKHKVGNFECEEVFFNEPILLSDDVSHSEIEKRYYVLGKTNDNRLLFISFTIRNGKIRIISAREMNKKERRIYNEEENNT
jgi:uncharacterized protein